MEEEVPETGSAPEQIETDGGGQRPSVTARGGQRRPITDRGGRLPSSSDTDGQERQPKNELHTVTIREAVMRFESAGVPRSERTLVRWCGLDTQGLARLDCVLDQNDRRYLITPESIETAIEEERARARKGDQPPATQPSEVEGQEPRNASGLERELIEAKATIQWKDKLITSLGKDREQWFEQVQSFVDKLSEANREIGRLESEVRLLQAPKKGSTMDRSTN